MNADQKKRRRKELKERAVQRKLEKAKKLQEIQELDEDEELDVLETAEESPEEIVEDGEEEEEEEKAQKDMGMPMDVAMMVNPGPISFTELDELKQAQDEAQSIQEVTWDTNDLVRNILNSPLLDPTQKGDAMKAVADEFASRVTSEMADVQKDLDLLELEALIAHDRRSTSVFEYFGDFITKATLTASARKKIPTGEFALVTHRNGKTVKKYPIHDKAHVRNALARAAQMLKRGGQAASDARAALPKIHAAAKRMGIGANMAKERNAILVEKDANNNYRWVGWVSNNFIDWDGDIISENAHKEYVEWWEKNKEASPSFVCWHTPGTAREHPVDFITYEQGFLIASGILNEQEAAGLLKAQSQRELGMSHGTFVFGRDAKDPRIITKYRMYEISDLPLENAANPFTDFETLVKEVGMDKLAYLTQIMGSEEKAKAFLEKTGMKKEALASAGVESKEKVETPVPEKVPTPETVPSKEVNPVVPAVAPTVQEIVAQVMKEMEIDDLNAFVTQARDSMEKVPILEEMIKDMQGAEEDKLAEKLTPPASRFAWSQKNRASQADETLTKGKEDEKLKKSVPGVPEGYWLSELSNTAPINADEK